MIGAGTPQLLFVAPQGRTMAEFLDESTDHGWPSFRDAETVKENVRVLRDGETVSIDGTHLGHNLPDGKNRYCIDLVSVAGNPVAVAGNPVAPVCNMAGTKVYFGNGCFWHTQYDMYAAEREAPFSRSFNEVTAITGYAGGKGTGPAGQICYHGGPSDTEYSHYQYTEAVQVTLGSDD